MRRGRDQDRFHSREHFALGRERGPRFEGVQRAPLNALISQHAKVHGVPEALVHRVIRLESNYSPYASSRGNFGLMQIRHATAQGMGYEGLPAGLLDAETNLTMACLISQMPIALRRGIMNAP